uniref:G_PROTEIN_RECEP_F1_2 domain-containing protein n=1 Tax=Heterorhabditis bacteriophora TaxID=37862 RepID=A0A1I7XR34_HETBA
MGNVTVLGEQIRMIDLLIFTGLEFLGILAIVGNLALIAVLLRNKYLCRASFILMLNLAIADVLHGIVTTCYFYPPIVLKTTHVGELVIRLFNIVDWTAWAITLTHMSAICLDRLIAIMLYGRYNIIVTIPRIRNYRQGTQKSSSESSSSLLKQQRSQWHRASTMLLEMSMKMGSKHMATTDVREIAAKRANRQQQRILLQISVVALIFYAYMTAYYISYYSRYFHSTAAMVFNSFFYSTTHMINPVIYFSLNKEMRAQLWCAFSDLFDFVGCKKKDPYGFANTSTKINQSTKGLTSTCETAMSQEGEEAQSSSAGAESAEIQAIVNNASYESGMFSVKIISKEYQSLHDDVERNKMTSRERSAFLKQLLKVLQYTSSHSVQNDSLGVDPNLRTTRLHDTTLPQAVKGKLVSFFLKKISSIKNHVAVFRILSRIITPRNQTNLSYLNLNFVFYRYMRMSTTMQMIAKEPLEKFEQDINFKKKSRSMTTLDRQPLLDDEKELEEETSVDSLTRSRSSSLLSSLNDEHHTSELLPSESLAFLLKYTDEEEEYDYDDIEYL